MRKILVGASVLAITTSTLAAAPKKRPTPSKKAKPGSKAGPGAVDPGAIEMDSAKPDNATPPVTDTSDSTAPVEPSDAPAPTHATSSLAINDRPLTIQKDRFEVHGGLPITVVSIPDIAGNSTSSTLAGLTFGGSYGIADHVEVGGDYGISLHPGDIKGALTLHGAYLAIAKPAYDLAVGGAFIVHPIEYSDPVSNMSFTTTYVAVQAGAWFRYRITPVLTAFTGLPALPHPDISLARSGFAFPPMPYQLTLGLNNNGAIGLSLPIGIGYQAMPNLYAFAATNLANIKISHTENALLFADFVPLTVGGFYSLRNVDLGAVISDDLRQPADYVAFSIVARYFVR